MTIYRFLVRGGTAAAIAALNEIPLAREIIYETDTRKWKVGNGVTHYNSLPYYGSNLWQPLDASLSEIAALGDPGADRLLFFDESAGSAGEFQFLTLGTNLSITGTTLNATSGSAGALKQVVATASTTTASTTTAIPVDNTIPQNTEGAAFASLDTTITPTSAASILEVEVHIPIMSGSTTIDHVLALFRDSGADALFAQVQSITNNNYTHQGQFIFRVVAGSTSATTFKLRYGPHSGAVTAYMNRTAGISAYFNGTALATMIIREMDP